MKNLIIIVGTIMLGLIIFNFMIGDSNTLQSVSKDAMIHSVSQYNE